MAVFKKGKSVSEQAISTLISGESVIEGNLKAPAYARIDGHITGNVTVDEGLILGEKGLIDGDVTTKEMVVHGIVNGNITADTIEIKASGKVTGNIRTSGFAVDAGGVYNGSIVMNGKADKQ